MNFQIPGFPDLEYGSLYCIGRNYVEHIREMNSERTSDPVVFLKPRSSIIHHGDTVELPSSSGSVQHEAELVILIGSKTQNVSPQEAASAIRGVGVGIDITARDLQSEAKKKGLPWTLSKGFSTFAPVGEFEAFDHTINLQDLDIELSVNGEIRQRDRTSKMIFPVFDLVSYLSRQFLLTPGDLIFTGTPSGVSDIRSGDHIEAKIGNLPPLSVHVS